MAEREKLIELLCKAHSKGIDLVLFEDATYAQQLETEADFLIDNGVMIPVKCKDCKHYEIHKPKVLENCERNGYLIPMKPEDFCSYGEKRGDSQ